MAKTYSNNSPESGPNQASASPSYTKLLPLIVGLLALFLVIGLVIRAQNSRQAVPGASSGVSETGGAARTTEETPTQSAQGTLIAPPGPKGARATGN